MADYMTKCPICKKAVSYTGLPKHLFSQEHMPFWKNCIKTNIQKFRDWITSYEEGKTTTLPLFTLVEKGDYYRVCFGCKKFCKINKSHKCKSDEKLKECAEMYKKLIKEIEDDPATDVPVDVRTLQKKIAQLEKMREVDEIRLEKSEAYRDFAKFLIEEIQFESLTAYKEIIEKCEEQYPELKGDVWGVIPPAYPLTQC